jgi:hypothetical protein
MCTYTATHGTPALALGTSASLVRSSRSMTGEAFRAYVGQYLAPELAKGNVVVMNNLSAHKVAGVEAAIQARAASLL